MLVIARKFNDIFYSMSTKEWKKANKHYLLIISSFLTEESFPMVDCFDEVFVVKSPDKWYSPLYEMFYAYKFLKHKQIDYVTTCNLALVSHLFILNHLSDSKKILIEDGLMNYFLFKPSQRMSKRLVKFLFGIKENKVLSSIYKTYLLKPDEAVYFYGEKEKIVLDKKDFIGKLDIDYCFKNKKVFVGQPFYNTGIISIEDYNNLVNNIIKKFNIDYYLPHRVASKDENISCPILDLTNSKVTLEVYASYFEFELYGFSSSVLYSTKCINPNIKTYVIDNSFVDKKAQEFINHYVDSVIKV